MSAARHDTQLTADGLTACCGEDPRTVDGGFALDLAAVTCSPVDLTKAARRG